MFGTEDDVRRGPGKCMAAMFKPLGSLGRISRRRRRNLTVEQVRQYRNVTWSIRSRHPTPSLRRVGGQSCCHTTCWHQMGKPRNNASHSCFGLGPDQRKPSLCASRQRWYDRLPCAHRGRIRHDYMMDICAKRSGIWCPSIYTFGFIDSSLQLNRSDRLLPSEGHAGALRCRTDRGSNTCRPTPGREVRRLTMPPTYCAGVRQRHAGSLVMSQRAIPSGCRRSRRSSTLGQLSWTRPKETR